MMARTRTVAVARWLLTALLLLVMFGCMHDQAQAQTQSQAQTQGTRATVGSQPEAARVPPPGDDDPTAPPYNGALPAGQTVPDTMVAGGSYTVTVKMKNTGNTSWTSEGAYRLGSNNPTDNWTWGGARVALAAEIPPGETSVFTFQVTAPANPGSYNFQWGMVQDGVQWFGAPSNNVVVNVVAAPRNGAQFVTQSVPASMTAGQAYSVTVAMLNTGNTTWNVHGDIGLASANPLANNTWNAGRIDMPATTAPGQTATSTFQVVAPNTPGTYNFQWNMVQDGIEWFGSPSTNLAITVSAPPTNGAVSLAMNVPPLTQGQNATISVTMQNTGNTIWPAGSNYKLGSQNPGENLIWGVQRVDLASDVAPGQSYTFTFPITAPASGTYTMQWQMMQRYVEWFGGLASTSVTVDAPAGDTVTYIHTDALGSPVARSDSAGTVISRTSYEPYGRPAGGVTPTIGFTGHVNDADSGLVYMQQRYYDPVAGRFLSVDPVVTDSNKGGSFNRYAYAENSPFKYLDPDGREARMAGNSYCESYGCGGMLSKSETTAQIVGGVVGAAVGAAVGTAGAAACDLMTDGVCIPANPLIVRTSVLAGRAAGQAAGPVVLQSSRTLGMRIAKVFGIARQKGWEAHHIVAENEPRAQMSQQILRDVRMDINSPFNGMWMPSGYHRGLHTNDYYTSVDAVLYGATTYSEVVLRLTTIRAEIYMGLFPY